MRRSLAFLAVACSAILLAGCSKGLHTVTKGPWQSPVTMVSVTAAESRSYVWSGTLSGKIDEDGRVSLSASNGCRLDGVAEPKFGRWAVPLHATGCSAERLNTSYDGVITFEQSHLLLTARSVVLDTTTTVVSEMRAEMLVPEPAAANL